MTREELDSVLEGLETAVSTIRALHGMGMSGEQEQRIWALYQQSPEMQKIKATIALVDGKIRESNLKEVTA
jgi:hypothetical protein